MLSNEAEIRICEKRVNYIFCALEAFKSSHCWYWPLPKGKIEMTLV